VTRTIGWTFAAGLLAFAVTGAAAARADDIKLRVIMFSGPQDMAVLAAQDQGLYAKRGLVVDVQFTPNSQALRDGIAKGSYEIASAGVDNAVYMVEVSKVDVVAVAGGDDGMNQLMARPEIQSYGDIRGKTVIVDAVDTAFALQLYKMLELKGLKRGDYTVVSKGGTPLRLAALRDDKTYVAGMLNLPWTILGERAGLHSLGTAVKEIGPYQGTCVWMLRSWAAANSDTLVKYLQATIEGLRWARAPANRTAASAILARTFKLEPDVAQLALERAFAPDGGIAEDARVNLAGFRNTLALRAALEGGTAAAPEKYLDLSYYDRALKGL